MYDGHCCELASAVRGAGSCSCFCAHAPLQTHMRASLCEYSVATRNDDTMQKRTECVMLSSHLTQNAYSRGHTPGAEGAAHEAQAAHPGTGTQ